MARVAISLWLIVVAALFAANLAFYHDSPIAILLNDGPIHVYGWPCGAVEIHWEPRQYPFVQSSWKFLVWRLSNAIIRVNTVGLVVNLALPAGITALLARSLNRWGLAFRRFSLLDVLLLTLYAAALLTALRAGRSQAGEGLCRWLAISAPILAGIGLIVVTWIRTVPAERPRYQTALFVVIVVACTVANLGARSTDILGFTIKYGSPLTCYTSSISATKVDEAALDIFAVSSIPWGADRDGVMDWTSLGINMALAGVLALVLPQGFKRWGSPLRRPARGEALAVTGYLLILWLAWQSNADWFWRNNAPDVYQVLLVWPQYLGWAISALAILHWLKGWAASTGGDPARSGASRA